MTTAKDLAENAWLAVVARFSMIALAPLFAATVWLGSQWLDQRFGEQATSTAGVADRVKALETDNLPGRISILESTIVIKGAARDQQLADLANQEQMQSVKLDKLTDAVNALAQSNAALDATLKAQDSRQ